MVDLLAQVDPNSWAELVKVLGIPGALLIGFIVVFLRGGLPSPGEVAALKIAIAAGEVRERRLEAQFDQLATQYQTIALPTLADALAGLRESVAMDERVLEALKADEEGRRRVEAALAAVMERLRQ